MPAVFGEVTLKQVQFHVHRELRERVFHHGRATIQLALVMIKFRHDLVGARVGAGRKAYRRAAFRGGLGKPAIAQQELGKPKARIVKCRRLFGCNLSQLDCKRSV